MVKAIVAVTAALSIVASTAISQGRPAAVGVQTVDSRVLSETIPVFAEVVTARQGAVAGRIAGNVETVHVLAGDRVEEGDVLIELSRELLSIRLTQSEARVAEAEAGTVTAQTQLDQAKIPFERTAALRGTSTFSQGRFDDLQANLFGAQARLDEAEAREKSAQAQLAETRYQLDRTQITAPFSGIILEVTTIPGAFIQAGTPVVRMLDTGAFEVEASVPASYIEFLEPGDKVAATTETGTAIDLSLRAIIPVENPSTRTRTAIFTAENGSGKALVAVGQSITVNVPIGEAREMLSVPKDALVQARGGWTVFVAAENKAEPRNVTIGVPLGDRYEVLSGLAEGDLVVVRGNERLRPGQDIIPNMMGTDG